MGAKKVVVAMSGGVDSSLCAALLKDRGFAVIGITMQLLKPQEGQNSCCGIDSIEDAKKVAYRLGIPHYVLNFKDVFREKVIANFCAEYQDGRTPNPCIRCNRYIKFGALLNRVRQLDARYIATGHYARIEFDPHRKRYLLKKGLDAKKDQSYVLYVMNQQQLKQTLMPLGELTKERVREIAKTKGLPVANKPESQEICFISNDNYGQFLQEYMPGEVKPGPIVSKEGKIIGEHQGIIFYTIGQRKRIGIAASEPLYVISIDQRTNTIVVGKKEDVYSNELIAEQVNYIYMNKPKAPFKAEVKVRYLNVPAKATIIPLDRGRVRVKFDQPQWAVTPGQAAVFYQGDVVVGGGVIASRNCRQSK